MNPIFQALAARFPSAAQCAAALGISRQAYSQARARGRLSERAALSAAALLGIDPAAALLANATGKSPPAPICQPAAPLRYKPVNLHYVKFCREQKRNARPDKQHAEKMPASVHSITSQERLDAFDVVRWCMAVAHLAADSPRFCYYVSRWDVPGKIARAKAAGTFDDAISACPPIDPAWLRFVPAALEAHREFTKPRQANSTNARIFAHAPAPSNQNVFMWSLENVMTPPGATGNACRRHP